MLSFKQFISLSEEQLAELLMNRSAKPGMVKRTPVAGGGVATSQPVARNVSTGPVDRRPAKKIKPYQAAG